MGFPPVKQPLAFEAEALARRCPGKRGRKKDISRNVLPEDYVAPEERANQLGTVLKDWTPAEVDRFARSEVAAWAQVIRDNNITMSE